MLLGWWNLHEQDWIRKDDKFKIVPEKEDYNKAQLLNMTGILTDFDVPNLSYTNLAVFTIARVINDTLGINVFDYKSIFSDSSLNDMCLSDEIGENGSSYINEFVNNTNKLYDISIMKDYIVKNLDANISSIYNTGIAYNTVTPPELTSYYPRVTVIDTYKATADQFVAGYKYGDVSVSQLEPIVNTFTANYYSAINTVLGEAINYINQKVSEIKNQQELNSIMPSGPIDLVTRINPEAAAQQPVQQTIPVQPVQQVNPAALSPEEEKAVQMMVNGMFFENMMQNAQQGVPVPQM